MKIFITDEQKTEREHRHHTCRDKRECSGPVGLRGLAFSDDRQALRLHEMTVNRHISDYLNHRKLKPENGGSQSPLSKT